MIIRVCSDGAHGHAELLTSPRLRTGPAGVRSREADVAGSAPGRQRNDVRACGSPRCDDGPAFHDVPGRGPIRATPEPVTARPGPADRRGEADARSLCARIRYAHSCLRPGSTSGGRSAARGRPQTICKPARHRAGGGSRAAARMRGRHPGSWSRLLRVPDGLAEAARAVDLAAGAGDEVAARVDGQAQRSRSENSAAEQYPFSSPARWSE